jgi:hypothetical protein
MFYKKPAGKFLFNAAGFPFFILLTFKTVGAFCGAAFRSFTYLIAHKRSFSFLAAAIKLLFSGL